LFRPENASVMTRVFVTKKKGGKLFPSGKKAIHQPSKSPSRHEKRDKFGTPKKKRMAGEVKTARPKL